MKNFHWPVTVLHHYNNLFRQESFWNLILVWWMQEDMEEFKSSLSRLFEVFFSPTIMYFTYDENPSVAFFPQTFLFWKRVGVQPKRVQWERICTRDLLVSESQTVRRWPKSAVVYDSLVQWALPGPQSQSVSWPLWWTTTKQLQAGRNEAYTFTLHRTLKSIQALVSVNLKWLDFRVASLPQTRDSAGKRVARRCLLRGVAGF